MRIVIEWNEVSEEGELTRESASMLEAWKEESRGGSLSWILWGDFLQDAAFVCDKAYGELMEAGHASRGAKNKTNQEKSN